jgi:hypothetical protein
MANGANSLGTTEALNILAKAIKAEDAAHTSGDKGLMLLAVRKDVAAALAGTDLDFIPLTVDSTGRLRIAALPANSGTDIGDVDVASIVPIDRRAIPSVAGDLHAPADNTSAVVTYAAGATTKHYLHDVFWAYDSTLTAVGTLAISDAGTVVFGPLPITQSGPGFLHFDAPIVSSAVNGTMVVTLTTGGATVQGVLSCRHEAR